MPTKTEIKADIVVEFSSARIGKKKEQCLKVTTNPILDKYALSDEGPMHHMNKRDDANGRFSVISSLGDGLRDLEDCCDEMAAEGKTHPLEPFFSGETDELVIVIRRKRAKKNG
jgi:hypothetical protein